MDVLTYYATQSPITDPGEHEGSFARLPGTAVDLCRVVQGLYIHYLSDRYPIPPERLDEVNLRFMTKMLARIVELDARPLTEPRSLERRLIGCCRDATVLLCAMARAQGIPARVRVGFAGYFTRLDPDFYCSHMVAEIWDAGERRWRLVDPELDERTVRENNVRFDVCDVPRDQFLVGGQAWQLCRARQADPGRFGVSRNGGMSGLAFVRGNLIQDLAALNKMELLNWDCWGLMLAPLDACTDQDWALLDRVAALTQTGDDALPALRTLYEAEAALKVPQVITCFNPVGAPGEVILSI